MNRANEKPGRIDWIDFLKGVAIFLVICGHTIGNFYVRSFIFSFHMPLFFFLSGITFNPSKDFQGLRERAKKSFKHLIIPAYTIWAVRSILYFFINGIRYSPIQYLLSAFWASGDVTQLNGYEIPAFGMMWFLVVLFSIRTIHDLIQLRIEIKTQGIIVLIVCVIGMLIGRCCYLPLSFDVTMASLVFFYGGIVMKNTSAEKPISFKYIGLPCVMWGGVFTSLIIVHKHFEIATRNYPYLLVSVVMALSACYFLCAVTSKVNLKNKVTQTIIELGQNSMVLFAIHAFDTVWYPYIDLIGNKLFVLVVRVGIDLLLLLAYCKTVGLVTNIRRQ